MPTAEPTQASTKPAPERKPPLACVDSEGAVLLLSFIDVYLPLLLSAFILPDECEKVKARCVNCALR